MRLVVALFAVLCFVVHGEGKVSADPCFPGAIYRKALSPLDTWISIEAEVVLPSTQFDSKRVDSKGT